MVYEDIEDEQHKNKAELIENGEIIDGVFDKSLSGESSRFDSCNINDGPDMTKSFRFLQNIVTNRQLQGFRWYVI